MLQRKFHVSNMEQGDAEAVKALGSFAEIADDAFADLQAPAKCQERGVSLP